MNQDLETYKIYQEAFSTESGKQVLKDLFVYARMMTSPFVPADPTATAFECGKQEAVKYIIQRCSYNLFSYLKEQELQAQQLIKEMTQDE